MPAENVPLVIDQGEDYTAQIVWTDEYGQPQNVIAPMRLDVKAGGVQPVLSLTTPDVTYPADAVPLISYSSNIGMIQIHIPKEMTENIPAGEYFYDMFVTINDGAAYAGDQTMRLLVGTCVVNRRITVM